MISNEQAFVNLPNLPSAAKQAHIFPNISKNLLSLGQLCDTDCEVKLTKNKIVITRNHQIILQGTRNHLNGMWLLPLTSNQPKAEQEMNNILSRKTKKEIVEFMHAACFSPTIDTLLKAVRSGFFKSWPGLTEDNIKKYLKPSIATLKGHMDQQRQNTNSTKKIVALNLISAGFIDLKGQIYTDQTGRFPVISRNGMQYLLVLYDHDTNAILVEPIKNRCAQEILRAYNKLYEYLKSKGYTPKLQRLDNEASNLLIQSLKQKQIDFQLVPPNSHRRNAAERAIRTFKNHFIAGLCSVDPHFPLQLWDKLLQQAVITLNLLRPSRCNPTKSAYEILEGNFDYNKTPLAPPGTKVLMFNAPLIRKSWDPHCEEGWYVGPALNHYRCFTIIAKATSATRIVETVHFLPKYVKVPAPNTAEELIIAAKELTEQMKTPAQQKNFEKIGQQQYEAIKKLQTIFSANQHCGPNTKITQLAQIPAQHISTSKGANEKSSTPSFPNISQRCTNPYHTSAPQAIKRAHRYPTRYQLKHSQAAMNYAVVNEHTGKPMGFRELINHSPEYKAIWSHSFANELGRLTQGVGQRMPTGTQTLAFINRKQVPANKKATYARIVAEIRPQKDEIHRTRLTVGGNLIQYPYDVSTPTSEMTTSKILFNSVLSTPNAKFMGIDIKDFYLNSYMKDPEYMWISYDLLPDEIIEQYKLHQLTYQGRIYCRIDRGMYGLPQAGKLAYDQLKTHMQKYGYFPVSYTPGLWKHTTNNIVFCLTVDDFGVKYTKNDELNHLLSALRDKYTISVDMKGTRYCGMTLKWNYKKRTLDVSMPGYVTKLLSDLKHIPPKRQQHAPHPWIPISYGSKTQYDRVDTSAALPPHSKKQIQEIVGSLLYYARAVDCTMLPALNAIATQQSTPTENTMKAVTHLLNYATTHPNAVLRYRASDMILHVHSDASYLNETNSKSRIAGHFFLSDKPKSTNMSFHNPILNAPIHTECRVLKLVVASAAEAEIGALFHNTQHVVVLRRTLEEMGHPQPPTPIQVDNTTALGFVSSSIRQKRTKSVNMRFFWLKDRQTQKHINIYWRPADQNLADYFTKHHPPTHHKRMRASYLINHLNKIQLLSTHVQGCVKSNPVCNKLSPVYKTG